MALDAVAFNIEDIKLDAELAQVDPLPSDDALLRLWERATRELARVVPRLSQRLSAGDVDPEDVSDVLNAMIMRVLRNPIGARSVSVDDAQVTLDQTLSAGELYVSAAEIATLSPAISGRRRMGTIQLGMSEYQIPQAT